MAPETESRSSALTYKQTPAQHAYPRSLNGNGLIMVSHPHRSASSWSAPTKVPVKLHELLLIRSCDSSLSAESCLSSAPSFKITSDIVPILCMSNIEEMRQCGDDFFSDTVLAYFDQCFTSFEALRVHFENGNFEEISRTAHYLKGSAGTLGLQRLQCVLTELQVCCTPGPSQDLQRSRLMYGKLKGVYDATSNAVRESFGICRA
eukprot:Opistho-2@7299